MTIYLLDVNVLIALLDPTHTFALAANLWFQQIRERVWATCPLTENGAIRIMSSSSYPSASANPVDHAQKLSDLCEVGQHEFWPDDISSRDILSGDIVPTATQITDLYLLALAVEHGGKLATFDSKIPAHLLQNGVDALELIRA